MRPDTSPAPRWPSTIAVSINDSYGDPFISEQLGNTIEKSRALHDHGAPIAIFTKAGMSPDLAPGLAEVARNGMVVPFYSLTGLDEGGISWSKRLDVIRLMKETFGYVVILTRPIIAGRNDDPATLERLVAVAAETSQLMVVGGVHDKYKRKREIRQDAEEFLLATCRDSGVRAFYKSSCLGAYIHGQRCWMHDLGAPVNTDVAAELGYDFEIVDGRLVLHAGSTGDLNFLRMLTRSEVSARELTTNYNIMTLDTPGRTLECTSSWFAWARNIDTCVGCNYCIILQIEYLQKKLVDCGCHPAEISALVAGRQTFATVSEFSRTKLRENPDRAPESTYADVRRVTPCLVHAYPSDRSLVSGSPVAAAR